MAVRRRVGWIRALSGLQAILMLHTYGGGVEARELIAQHQRVAEHNTRITRRLGVVEDTEADVARRRAEAHAKIRATRAEELQRLAAGRARLARELPEVEAAQLPPLLVGLSDTARDLTASLRRLTEAPDAAQIVPEGRRLFFLSRNLASLADRLEAQGALPAEALARVDAVVAALAPLGDAPAAFTPALVTQAARAARQTVEAHLAADERAWRLGHGGARRLPAWEGFDPLTGEAPRRPHPPTPKHPEGALPRLPLEPDTLATLAAGVRGAEITQRATPASAPTPDDLSPTVDAPLSPAIQAQADTLGGDPRALFDFVRTEVDTAVYAGSLLGAEGALENRDANDVDQASLLIALLRAAGHPARYVTGTAFLSAAQLRSMTGFEEVGAAVGAFNLQGVPATATSLGGVSGANVQHTWVLAWVPYTDYRGLDGTATGGAKVWVNLDPSLKGYTLRQDVDLAGRVPFDEDAYLSEPPDRSPLEAYEDDVRAWLQVNDVACESLTDLTVRRVRDTHPSELLPNQTPWTLVGSRVVAPSLSATTRHVITLEMVDGWGFTSTRTSTTTVEVYGRRLAMTFPNAAGAIPSSTSGEVKPTFSAGGSILKQGGGVPAGMPMFLYASVDGPGTAAWSWDHPMVAGGTYVLHLWRSPAARAPAEEIAAEVASLEAQGASQGRIDLAVADLAGWIFHASAGEDDRRIWGYGGQLDLSDHETMTGTSMATVYAFGFPAGAVRRGYLIDAHSAVGVRPLASRYTRSTRDAAILSGWSGSWHEQAVWGEAADLGALSTTRILQLARAQGQTVFSLESRAEYDTVKGQLTHEAKVLTDVEAALGRGERVLISNRAVTSGGRTLSGWVTQHQSSGLGRYMISGQLGGAESTDDPWLRLLGMLGYGEDINSRANLATASLSDFRPLLPVIHAGAVFLAVLTYHSDQVYDGDVGPGWSWTWGERLYTQPNGDVVRLSWTGANLTYTAAAGGFTPPLGLPHTLTRTAAGFSLVEEDARIYDFDTAGRLVRTVDSFGREILVTRKADGRLDALKTPDGAVLLTLLTDGAGHLVGMKDRLNLDVAFTYTGGRISAVTDPVDGVWAYSHGADGRIIGRVGADGVPISYGWSGDGELISHSTPDGSVGAFAYDRPNRRASWRTPTGQGWLYRFDAFGQLIERVDPEGNNVALTWEGGRVVEEVDARGEITRRAWNDQGLLVREDLPDGTHSLRSWDDRGRLLSRVDPDGTSTTWTWDDTRREMVAERSDGVEARLAWNEDGAISHVQDGRGGEQHFEYDGAGRLDAIVSPDAGRTAVRTDANGRITALTSADGGTQTFAYDGAGRLTDLIGGGGSGWSYSYTPHGDLREVVGPAGPVLQVDFLDRWPMAVRDAAGREIQFERDALGHPTALIEPGGHRTEFTLDGVGRVVEARDGLGNVVSAGYCAAEPTEPCDVVDTLGNLTQRRYDDAGRVVAEENDLGVWTWERDGLGRVVSQVDPLGQETRPDYDAQGRLVSLLDAEGGLTRYDYGALGLVTDVVDAEDRRWSQVRDSAGRVRSRATPDQRITTLEWTPSGQLSRIVNPSGAFVDYTYDADALLVAAQPSDGDPFTWTRDGAGRVVGSASAAAVLERQYWGASREVVREANLSLGLVVDVELDPTWATAVALHREEGTERRVLDGFGRLARVELPRGEWITQHFDRYGRLTRRAFSNGLEERRTWDRWSRLSALSLVDAAGVVVLARAYTWDALGRIVEVRDGEGTSTRYEYDGLSRLTAEIGPAGELRHTYDAVGNRLSTLRDGVVIETFGYDEAHRLVEITDGAGQTTVGSDEDGRVTGMTGARRLSLGYDVEGRLVEARRGAGQTITYAYDAEGRRAWRDDGAARVHTFWWGPLALTEVEDDGSPVRSYFHGDTLDAPWATYEHQQGGAVRFLHFDGVGNLIAASDSGGTLRSEHTYDAFGARTTVAGEAAPALGLRGRPLDPDTGLYDLRARELDPRTGRLLQPDPRTLDTFERARPGVPAALSAATGPSRDWLMAHPEALHPYTYVGGDPVNRADPSGESIELLSLQYLIGITFMILSVIKNPVVVLLIAAAAYIVNLVLMTLSMAEDWSSEYQWCRQGYYVAAASLTFTVIYVGASLAFASLEASGGRQEIATMTTIIFHVNIVWTVIQLVWSTMLELGAC